ncbi:hypothetical protein QYF36_013469 [Acer negundo]|nr:hypothetical protein QYF36_013469 [Acer negundo]
MSSSNARDINLSPWAFVKMEKLRLLKFYVSDDWWNNRSNKVHAPEGLEYVFTELRYLHWYGFPLKSLQPNFQLENLVILKMPNSNVEELWSGFQTTVGAAAIDRGFPPAITLGNVALWYLSIDTVKENRGFIGHIYLKA